LTTKIKPKEQKVIQQAQAFLSQNDPLSSKSVLIDYAKKNKHGPYTVYYLNLSRAVLGEMDDAIGPVEKLVTKYPNEIEYLKLLGGIQHALHQYDNAILTFQGALKVNSSDFQTLSNIASSLKEVGQLDDAESYFQQSLTVQPNQPDALTNYGLLMQVDARLDEAILMHQKALQYSPEHHAALYNLAYALNEKGEHRASLQVYLKVLDAQPDHIKALCDIAHVYGQLKLYDTALPYLQHAKTIAPENKQVHLTCGHTHRMLKDFAKAEACYKEVFRIEPNDATAKYFIAMMKGDDSIKHSPDAYVQELFDGYADTFDDHLIGKLQYKTPELIANMVKKHVAVEAKYKILDLGCGTGLAGVHLADISKFMVGVDLSEKMIKKAKHRGIYNELYATGINQFFDERDYQPEIVVSADVFVYIGDISDVFESVSKAMDMGGVFVFSTEDTEEGEKYLLRESGRFAHNEKYIHVLAKKYGFEFIDNQKTIIRYEAEKPIHGQVYLLKRD